MTTTCLCSRSGARRQGGGGGSGEGPPKGSLADASTGRAALSRSRPLCLDSRGGPKARAESGAHLHGDGAADRHRTCMLHAHLFRWEYRQRATAQQASPIEPASVFGADPRPCRGPLRRRRPEGRKPERLLRTQACARAAFHADSPHYLRSSSQHPSSVRGSGCRHLRLFPLASRLKASAVTGGGQALSASTQNRRLPQPHDTPRCRKDERTLPFSPSRRRSSG